MAFLRRPVTETLPRSCSELRHDRVQIDLGDLGHARPLGQVLEDHTVALGQVMNLELWQRFFVDGDAITGEAPLLTAAQPRERPGA